MYRTYMLSGANLYAPLRLYKFRFIDPPADEENDIRNIQSSTMDSKIAYHLESFFLHRKPHTSRFVCALAAIVQGQCYYDNIARILFS